jgi:hypothetical protein
MIKAMLGLMLAASLAAAAGPTASVDDLGWLSGRWETASGDGWTEEVWSAPRGGRMIGFSRAGRGETVREFEFLRLEAGDDGVPVYLASPSGRPPIGFRLVEVEPTSVTFANPAHDFPQRIRYRRDGDTLTATISAGDGSNATSWSYRRGQ